MKRHRGNMVMVKLDVPKKVTLPNGRIFYEKRKRVRIDSLPNNVRIRRRYRRTKNNQQGRRLKDILMKRFKFVKKRVGKSKVGNSLAKVATENAP